jgi:hypothetical protein
MRARAANEHVNPLAATVERPLSEHYCPGLLRSLRPAGAGGPSAESFDKSSPRRPLESGPGAYVLTLAAQCSNLLSLRAYSIRFSSAIAKDRLMWAD